MCSKSQKSLNCKLIGFSVLICMSVQTNSSNDNKPNTVCSERENPILERIKNEYKEYINTNKDDLISLVEIEGNTTTISAFYVSRILPITKILTKDNTVIYYYHLNLSFNVDQEKKEIILRKDLHEIMFIYKYHDNSKLSSHVIKNKLFSLLISNEKPQKQDNQSSFSQYHNQIGNTMSDQSIQHNEISSSGVKDDHEISLGSDNLTNIEISSTSP